MVTFALCHTTLKVLHEGIMAGCLSTKLCVMDFSPPNDNDVPTIRADPPLFEPSPGSFQAPEITPGAFAHAQDAVTKSIHRQLHQIPEAESYESNNFVPFTRSVKPTPFYGGSGVSRDDPHVDEQHHEDDWFVVPALWKLD